MTFVSCTHTAYGRLGRGSRRLLTISSLCLFGLLGQVERKITTNGFPGSYQAETE